MQVDHGQNVKYKTGTEPEFYGLLVKDGLRIFKGTTGGLKIQRRPDNTGSWIDWSKDDCKVTVEGKLPGTPEIPVKIVITASGGKFDHYGEVGGITGASWTAEEGP